MHFLWFAPFAECAGEMFSSEAGPSAPPTVGSEPLYIPSPAISQSDLFEDSAPSPFQIPSPAISQSNLFEDSAPSIGGQTIEKLAYNLLLSASKWISQDAATEQAKLMLPIKGEILNKMDFLDPQGEGCWMQQGAKFIITREKKEYAEP